MWAAINLIALVFVRLGARLANAKNGASVVSAIIIAVIDIVLFYYAGLFNWFIK